MSKTVSFEVIEAVLNVWPANRAGIRILPSGVFNDMTDSDPRRTFGYFVEQLNRYSLAYLHIVEPEPVNEPDPASFYGGDEHGYIDYPTLEELAA